MALKRAVGLTNFQKAFLLDLFLRFLKHKRSSTSTLINALCFKYFIFCSVGSLFKKKTKEIYLVEICFNLYLE